ncbi:hypothetical protein RhiirC2_727820, partial [Rhizophagus irregularis]
MAPTYYPKEKTVMINNNNSVDIELSPQPNSVTSLNESIIQSEYETKAFDYTLEVPTSKYIIIKTHLVIIYPGIMYGRI